MDSAPCCDISIFIVELFDVTLSLKELVRYTLNETAIKRSYVLVIKKKITYRKYIGIITVSNKYFSQLFSVNLILPCPLSYPPGHDSCFLLFKLEPINMELSRTFCL